MPVPVHYQTDQSKLGKFKFHNVPANIKASLLNIIAESIQKTSLYTINNAEKYILATGYKIRQTSCKDQSYKNYLNFQNSKDIAGLPNTPSDLFCIDCHLYPPEDKCKITTQHMAVPVSHLTHIADGKVTCKGLPIMLLWFGAVNRFDIFGNPV